MAPEREDQFTSLITVLFDMRLVTVRGFFRLADSDLIIMVLPPARMLKVNSVIGRENEVF